MEQDQRLGLQVELLKKEKAQLLSKLTAQESVMDGLKEERKIWGQELAQQGGRLGEVEGTRVARFKRQDLVYQCGIRLVIGLVTDRFIILELLLYNIYCFIDGILETRNRVSNGNSGHYRCARVNSAT